MKTKKVFLGCLSAWILGVVLMAVVMCRNVPSNADFMTFLVTFGVLFAGIALVMIYAFYFAMNLGLEKIRILFPDDYEELRRKWGPVLEETSVRIMDIVSYPKGQVVKLSICQEAMILSVRGNARCIPYARYSIYQKGGSLVVENIVPEELAKKVTHKMFKNRNSLMLNEEFSYKKDLDFVISLVEQAQQKQQDTPNSTL